MKSKERVKRQPTLAEALFVLLAFAVVIAVGYIGFGIRVEPLMCLSAVIGGIVAYRCGYKWADMEDGMCKKVLQAAPAMFIIWATGMVIAAMMYSGSIPMVIYYGLKIINPQFLYLCSFLVCCIMSVITGTSWGSAGTIGLAMMGVALGLELSPVITAAAVISGSIFGDKLSPLSETTNLAPLCAGCGLYEHIGSMMWTTIPASVIAGIVYLIAGLGVETEEGLPEGAQNIISNLEEMYTWSPLLLLPFALILCSALLKFPPVPTLFGSVILSLILGATIQGFEFTPGVSSIISGFTIETFYSGEVVTDVSTLLNRGGMSSMSSIIIILFCGYTFIGVVSATGILRVAVNPLMKYINGRVSLIFASLVTDLVILVCSGSSYPAHIVVGEMYRKKYIELGIELKVLSRSMEDVGTMIAPLVPWGSSGAFYLATLGVAAWGSDGYALWAVNTWLNPVVAMILAITGIGIFKMSKEKQAKEMEKYEKLNSARSENE